MIDPAQGGTMPNLTIIAEGDQGAIRIRTDAPGERAVSVLLTDGEAVAALEELAGILGYTVTPTGTGGA
jgi:hypothetical protein